MSFSAQKPQTPVSKVHGVLINRFLPSTIWGGRGTNKGNSNSLYPVQSLLTIGGIIDLFSYLRNWCGKSLKKI